MIGMHIVDTRKLRRLQAYNNQFFFWRFFD